MSKIPYNTTKQIAGEDSFGGKLTGRSEMIYIRNKYQTELDNANVVIVFKMRDLENSHKIFDNNYHNAIKSKSIIKTHLEEDIALHEELQKLLSTEQGSDHELWNKTLESRIAEMKDKKISIFQKNINSDIESINVGPSLNYPTKILNSDIKKRYEEVMTKMKEKKEEIRESKERYFNEFANYNKSLTYISENLQ